MRQDRFDFDAEAEKRDRALDLLSITRERLIAEARAIATRLARHKGTVTSTEVLAELYRLGYEDALSRNDKRFMGPVFRGKEWARVAYEPSGSHCRPVSVWRLKMSCDVSDKVD